MWLGAAWSRRAWCVRVRVRVRVCVCICVCLSLALSFSLCIGVLQCFSRTTLSICYLSNKTSCDFSLFLFFFFLRYHTGWNAQNSPIGDDHTITGFSNLVKMPGFNIDLAADPVADDALQWMFVYAHIHTHTRIHSHHAKTHIHSTHSHKPTFIFNIELAPHPIAHDTLQWMCVLQCVAVRCSAF